MADGQATRVCVNDATRIQLKQLMTEAQASTESLAASIEMLAGQKLLPVQLRGIARYAVDALIDLDDRISTQLDPEGVDHAA
jgi:hypothetical protein